MESNFCGECHDPTLASAPSMSVLFFNILQLWCLQLLTSNPAIVDTDAPRLMRSSSSSAAENMMVRE
jgi:hypothetical protein